VTEEDNYRVTGVEKVDEGWADPVNNKDWSSIFTVHYVLRPDVSPGNPERSGMIRAKDELDAVIKFRKLWAW